GQDRRGDQGRRVLARRGQGIDPLEPADQRPISQAPIDAALGKPDLQQLCACQVAPLAARQIPDARLTRVLGDFPSVSMDIPHYLLRASSEAVSTPLKGPSRQNLGDTDWGPPRCAGPQDARV